MWARLYGGRKNAVACFGLQTINAASEGLKTLHIFAAAGAGLAFLADFLIFVRDLLQFIIREMFDVHHLILSLVDRLDDLIQLQVNGPGVTVLGVLDQKHDQESDDGGAGIDDQLPGVRVVEVRPRNKPQCDDEQGCEEGSFRTDPIAASWRKRESLSPHWSLFCPCFHDRKISGKRCY
jgi:hypothetical protein